MSICYACMLLFPTVQEMEQHVCLTNKENYDDLGEEEDQEGQQGVLPKPITSEQLRKYETKKTETKSNE